MCKAVNELFADEIRELKNIVADMSSTIADKDSLIADKDSQIARQSALIAKLQADNAAMALNLTFNEFAVDYYSAMCADD